MKTRNAFPLMKLPILTVIGLLGSLSISVSALAVDPLRDPRGLAHPETESVLRVRTARVVLLDYRLVRRDFVETRMMSDAQIDAWIIEKVAFISQAQAAQTVTNTRIQVGTEMRIAYRPADYGRALVYPTGQGGLIDVKGTGTAETPQPGGHADGLATLGEATREFLYEKVVRTILEHCGSAYETVEHYGVVDLGFDVVHEDGTTSPAGLVLRQAHSRVETYRSLLSGESAREVELTLRRYGLTSAGAYRAKHTFEKINIQGTTNRGIIDFGGYLSVDRFDRPARNFYELWNILTPDQIDFVQPNARIRVPLANWGYSASGVADPKMDNPWVWSHELASNYRRGVAPREAFKTHFDNLVGSYRRSLFMLGGEARPGVMEALVRAIHDIH